MRGLRMGNLGRLKNCLQVKGLNQGLVSVSQMAVSNRCCVIFNKDGAYLVPNRHIWRVSSYKPDHLWPYADQRAYTTHLPLKWTPA